MLICFFALLHGVSAFDLSPEYQGLNEQALTRFEAPTDVDSEYQLIWSAYQQPFTWIKSWETNPRQFNYTAGSLSNSYFLTYSQAKIATDLTDTLQFRFTYFAQRDRESDQARHILELIQTVTPWLKVSAYGEPSMFKRENDIGGAVILTPIKNFENRFYYTRHDFTRNDHNDLSDRYTKGRESDSIGWAGVWTTDNIFFRGGFRYDQPVKWNRPQESRIFQYSKRLIYSDIEVPLSPASAVLLRAQWDDTFKEESPDSAASTVSLKSWRLKRSWLRASYSRGRDDEPFSYEAALAYVERLWTNQLGQDVLNRNLLPSVIFRYKSYQVGGEVNSYSKKDPNGLTPEEQLHAPIEARLNTSYIFKFKNEASLRLSLNFDVDNWRTVPAFEGGSGQFRTEF